MQFDETANYFSQKGLKVTVTGCPLRSAFNNPNPEKTIEEMGLDEIKGFLITSVTPNSPAERAGLRSGNMSMAIGGQTINIGGDVIVGIDGEDVVRIEDILSQIERHNVGETIHLIVIRDGLEVTFTLTLGERP